MTQKNEISRLRSRIKDLEQTIARYQKEWKPIPLEKDELTQLFTEIFDGTSLTDLKLQTIWASAAWQKLFGKDIEKLRDTFRYIHPDDLPEVEKAWSELVEQARPLQEMVFRYRLNKKDHRYFEISAFPVTIENKYLFYVVVRDITERKKAENDLRESEEKWRSLTQSSPDHIMLLDLDFKIQFINHPVPDLTTDEVIGRSNLDLLPPDYRQVAAACYNRVVDKGEPNRFETRYLDTFGKVQYFDIRVGPILNEMGEVEALVCSSTNITQRKRAEDAVVESELRLRMAGQVAYDLIYEWDVKSNSLEWFGDIDEMLGYQKGEISRGIKAWLKLIHPDERAQLEKAVERHRFSKEPLRYEYRVRHKNGRYRYWRDRGLPFLDNTGSPKRWVGVCTDITESREAEARLKQQHDHLEDLVKERTAELEKKNVELEEKNVELERFHDATVDREFRMRELRDQIQELEKKLAKAKRLI